MGGINDIVSGPLLLGLPVALLAGLVSFASPCVLPLVPGYLAYVSGFTDGVAPADRQARDRRRVVIGAALFVLGFAVVFVIFGIAFGAAGFWLVRWRDLITRVAGIVVIIMGIVFAGRLGVFQRTIKPGWRPLTGLIGAPVLGAVFAVGWTPCIGPTLATILSLSFGGGSPVQGAALGLAYAVGLGLPFVVVALGLAWAAGAVGWLRRHMRVINLIGGLLLIVIGVLMVAGVWNAWMLQLGAVMGSYVTAL
ncbi:cytochrome c biogenesis CcdA family protein [Amnibacterium flavum]|uniref:Cytochrome C biogenesis protein n=1 Tax=Amnibacterium flavum TaxID=2173173 RepID=A0A2V1HSL7_9MICO|nr:cytochrome c biogenesis protein CcdA [Amnibacterium flavum]PVZ95595.1 cytochrome C biogenesis protein [Amnibacterium flavum]